jgi:methylated-DNA-protein-cysteine methyltransferase-like protein
MGVRKKTANHTGTASRRVKPKSGGSGTQKQAMTDNEAVSPAQRIWSVVAMIPKGKVASYGQIAALAGMPRHARLVGRTLRELPKGSRLPWHRVVNATLRISIRPGGTSEQRQRLEAEDVEFVGEKVADSHRWEANAN